MFHVISFVKDMYRGVAKTMMHIRRIPVKDDRYQKGIKMKKPPYGGLFFFGFIWFFLSKELFIEQRFAQ
jgi:hypothetical protein